MHKSSHNSAQFPQNNQKIESLIVYEQFRMCKARNQKRKFIQKRSKQELKNYKQSLLNLVKKRSTQSLQKAQRKMSDLNINEHFQFRSNTNCNIDQCITILQARIKKQPLSQTNKIKTLSSECDRISAIIELKNKEDTNFIRQVANQLHQICLESINQSQ